MVNGKNYKNGFLRNEGKRWQAYLIDYSNEQKNR